MVIFSSEGRSNNEGFTLPGWQYRGVTAFVDVDL